MSHSSDRLRLAQLWQQWTAVVADSLRPSRFRRGVSAAEYQALHAALMAAIPHPTQPGSVYARMEEFCRPWVALEGLQDADQRIVRDLLHRARGLHRELVGARRRQPLAIGVLVSATCLAGGVGLWLLRDIRHLSWPSAPSMLAAGQSLTDDLARAWQPLSSLPWLAAVVLAVIALGVWMMKTTTRF